MMPSNIPLTGPLARSEGALAAATATATEPVFFENPGSALHPRAEVRYAIRVPRPAREVECPQCGARFVAAGPTGYDDDEPICDQCLLDGSTQLGMLLALASTTRGFGRMRPENNRQFWDMLVELAHFARFYEDCAQVYAPYRPFGYGRSPDVS